VALPQSPPPSSPPHRARVPVNVHDWADISFLHWPVEPDAIQAQLPPGLEVHARDGSAWVGVTPFRMRAQPLGPVPLAATFPETNVRTYVVDGRGRTGIWFLHMEVTAAWFVAALRVLGLPYHRRAMSIERAGSAIRYRSRAEEGAIGGHDITVRVEPGAARTANSPVERFLLARWSAYHRVGPVLARTPVEHAPWPVLPATTVHADVAGLFGAAGLSPPAGPPLTHFSPGVRVRVGVPRVVERRFVRGSEGHEAGPGRP
jgi:uncharacterized protein